MHCYRNAAERGALDAEAGMEAMSEVFGEKGGEIYLPAAEL